MCPTGGQLLCEELDNLEINDTYQSKESIACSDDLVPIHSSSTSNEDLKEKEPISKGTSISKESINFEELVPVNSKTGSSDKIIDSQLNDLLSPADESVSMFSQLTDKLIEMTEGDSGVDTAHNFSDEESCKPEVLYLFYLLAACTYDFFKLRTFVNVPFKLPHCIILTFSMINVVEGI